MTNVLAKLNIEAAKGGFTLHYPSFEITSMPTMDSIKQFEIAARTCYRSEDKITEDISSGTELLNKILRLNHTAMIEFFPDLVVKLRVNRGVSHEAVRQRICSFAQESTRYVRYNENVPYILPAWSSASHLLESPNVKKNQLFLRSCLSASNIYQEMLGNNYSPQEARGVLNNNLATYLNMKTNLREWLHIFGLRCDPAAHPDMRVIMCGLIDWLFANNELFHGILKLHYPLLVRHIDWFRKTYAVDSVEGVHYVVPYVDSATDYDMGNVWADK